jgi:hypothetical protein
MGRYRHSSRWLLIFCVLCGMLVLPSCVTTPQRIADRAGRDIDYALSATSNDVDEEFVIQVRSLSERTLCFHSYEWPSDTGYWSGQSGLFAIESAGEHVAPPDSDPGMCVGTNCVATLRPNEVRLGVLDYSVFGNADRIRSLKDKALTYNIVFWFC